MTYITAITSANSNEQNNEKFSYLPGSGVRILLLGQFQLHVGTESIPRYVTVRPTVYLHEECLELGLHLVGCYRALVKWG